MVFVMVCGLWFVVYGLLFDGWRGEKVFGLVVDVVMCELLDVYC